MAAVKEKHGNQGQENTTLPQILTHLLKEKRPVHPGGIRLFARWFQIHDQRKNEEGNARKEHEHLCESSQRPDEKRENRGNRRIGNQGDDGYHAEDPGTPPLRNVIDEEGHEGGAQDDESEAMEASNHQYAPKPFDQAVRGEGGNQHGSSDVEIPPCVAAVKKRAHHRPDGQGNSGKDPHQDAVPFRIYVQGAKIAVKGKEERHIGVGKQGRTQD